MHIIEKKIKLTEYKYFIFFQFFIFSKNGEIIFEEENCLDVSNSNPGATIEILKCHGFKGNQEWKHNRIDVSLDLAVIMMLIILSSVNINPM